MKTRMFLLVATLITALAMTAGAQQPLAKPAEVSSVTTATLSPEWPGEIMLVSEGKLVSLESQTPSRVAKVKMLGYRGSTTGLVFKGAASPISVGTRPTMVVKIALKSSPKAVIQLYRLQVVDGRRYLLLSKEGALTTSVANVAGDSQVNLQFALLGADVVEFRPSLPLTPGEYVSTIDGEPLGFLFRVE